MCLYYLCCLFAALSTTGCQILEEQSHLYLGSGVIWFGWLKEKDSFLHSAQKETQWKKKNAFQMGRFHKFEINLYNIYLGEKLAKSRDYSFQKKNNWRIDVLAAIIIFQWNSWRLPVCGATEKMVHLRLLNP